jgi:hypothetical protein
MGSIKFTSQKINDFVASVPGLLPEGMWLEVMDISQDNGKYHGTLSGAIFLGDDFKERTTIDKFISNLSAQGNSPRLFTKVELSSSERKEQNTYTITVFNINLE